VSAQESWLRSMTDYYATMMRTQLMMQFQYRAATYMYTLGMVAEPTIYLVVWSTIARSHGGSVNGLTPHAFAAYYIVWTLGPRNSVTPLTVLGCAAESSPVTGRSAYAPRQLPVAAQRPARAATRGATRASGP